jgi:isocitrate dehydrogenase (NAD+)
MSKLPATLIPGDGIGPEIVESVLAVLDALGAPFDWERAPAGVSAIASHGDPLPPSTLDSIRRNKLALKGPLTTPVGGGFKSVNVELRKEFELYANMRPVVSLIPGQRYENIDITLVRENLDGFYAAFEHYMAVGDDPKAVAFSAGFNTRAGSERIIRHAFDYAVANGRRKITVVHKANILKALTGIFLEAGRTIAKDYEGRVAMDERIVDACAMQLVMHPWQFDVIVTTNLFGDILSDLISGLVGGLGMAPGANIGKNVAIFEAVHGSAPDIAGKGVANPCALLLAAGLMLDHVGLTAEATRLREALKTALVTDGVRTRDLGGTASTTELTAGILKRI